MAIIDARAPARRRTPYRSRAAMMLLFLPRTHTRKILMTRSLVLFFWFTTLAVFCASVQIRTARKRVRNAIVTILPVEAACCDDFHIILLARKHAKLGYAELRIIHLLFIQTYYRYL